MRPLGQFCRAGAVVLVAGGLVGAGGAGVASAAQTQVFTKGVALGLPSDAATTAADGVLDGISCASQGSCTVIGGYNNANGDSVPMASTQTGGDAYPTATELALPASTHGLTIDGAFLDDVSCTGAGDCVATGNDSDIDSNAEPIVATESNGTWGQPVELSLPANADAPSANGTQSASLDGLSCWGSGDCVAVGGYTTGGAPAGLIETETNGQWQASQFIAVPSGGSDVSLSAVSCTADGTCTVVGSTAGAAETAFATSGKGGALASTTVLALPADAASGASPSPESVSCPADGDCTVTGFYTNTGNQIPEIAWTQSGGTFGAPVALGAPANSADVSAVDYPSVSCGAPGDCTAVGDYNDGTGIQDTAVSESAGMWGSAVELAQPAGAADVNGPTGVAVSCSAVSVCGIAGTYAADARDDAVPMTLSSYLTLAISTTTLPTATVGVPYSAQLTGSGGDGIPSWSLSSGVLPAGLTLNPATGVISGTPTAAESLSFTTALNDTAADTAATQPLAITVIPAQGATRLSPFTVKGLKLTTTITCVGSGTQTCSGMLQAKVKERLRGRTLISVAASRRPGRRRHHRDRMRTRTIVLGTAHYLLHGGQTETVTVRLGGRARRLLAAHRRLRVALSLTPTGSGRASVTRRVTLKGKVVATRVHHHHTHTHKKHQ